jgi:hypothetical protein
MPAGRPKSIDDSKVFDIARPGSGRPVEASRPVIANRSISVKDQMVTGVPNPPKEVLSAPSVSRKIIAPITEEDTLAPVATEVAATTTEEIAKEPEVEKAVDDTPTGSETAAVDALADATGKSREDQKAAEEQLKRDAALQELINSKKYVVPLAHDSTKNGDSKLAIIVLLALILLASGAYIAIDSKVLKTNINLPYHFFKQ